MEASVRGQPVLALLTMQGKALAFRGSGVYAIRPPHLPLMRAFQLSNHFVEIFCFIRKGGNRSGGGVHDGGCLCRNGADLGHRLRD